MGRHLRYAVMWDVQTYVSTMDYARNMEQHVKLACVKDVQTEPSKEGYASSMEQRRRKGRFAVMKNAPAKLNKGVCA